MIIAVDGPAASGKGTLSRSLAKHFGLAYLDTGKLYRAVAARALEAGVDLADAPRLVDLAGAVAPETLDDPRLGDEAVSLAASHVASVPEVRAALLDYQRRFAAHPDGAVLDGRDIGAVVCPDATVKLFVTASLEARAERRAKQLSQQEAETGPVDVAAVKARLAERDARDRGRAAAPLAQPPDAHLLDTTSLSIDAALNAAVKIVKDALAATQASS